MLLIGADNKPEGRDDDYGDGHGASYTTSALQSAFLLSRPKSRSTCSPERPWHAPIASLQLLTTYRNTEALKALSLSNHPAAPT